MDEIKKEQVQVREMIGDKPWAIRNVTILEDSGDSVLLWFNEGSQFVITEGYLNNPNFCNERWQISQSGQWNMIESTWKHNHVLIHKELKNYYSTQLFWNANTEEFLGYYINFELPYQRVDTGFDTLDLDLDMMVYPDLSMKMKDEKEYESAIRSCDIKPEWQAEINKAQQELLVRLQKQAFPFDGSLIEKRR